MPVTARSATPADAPDVVALQHRWDTHWFGAAEHDEADVRAELRRAEPLADRSRLLLDGDRLVAAAWWWRPDDPTVLVDPETDTGAAARDLMAWLARGGADAVEVLSRDTVLRNVLADLGWVHARSQFELIRPAEDLPPPGWPEGVAVSTLADDAEEVHRLVYEQAGWADVPGHTTRDLEEWRGLFVTGEDPSQQVLARLDGRLVGVAMGKVFPDGTGWVAQVAVHRDHQGRGLGSALLAEAFARRVAAGATQVGLGVSATNAGALRLYERLGLTIDREWMVYRHLPPLQRELGSQ
jgi:mycothiol synthase